MVRVDIIPGSEHPAAAITALVMIRIYGHFVFLALSAGLSDFSVFEFYRVVVLKATVQLRALGPKRKKQVTKGCTSDACCGLFRQTPLTAELVAAS